MRNFNYEYINTHYALMEAFLFKADKSVLDISYNIAEKQITIQVVLLEGLADFKTIPFRDWLAAHGDTLPRDPFP